MSSLDGTNGFIINGINPGGNLGISVSGAGDVNGDGIADIIIGASRYVFGTNRFSTNNFLEQSYMIFGSKAGFTSPFSLLSLNGVNGFTINGTNSYDGFGASVSGAGDVNGDGIDDIIMGAPTYNHTGQSYVIYGQNSTALDVDLDV